MYSNLYAMNETCPLMIPAEGAEGVEDGLTPNDYFATMAGTLASNLEEQISVFLLSHPDTVLIVVDTFQMVRRSAGDPAYETDYQEMQKLKRIADEHGMPDT